MHAGKTLPVSVDAAIARSGCRVHQRTVSIGLLPGHKRHGSRDCGRTSRNGSVGVKTLSIEPQTVAVVDDEPSVRTGLKRMLNASGFVAEVYASAEEFLARRNASQPTCLVVDINLGGMSGIELCRRMAAAGSCIPVIFITARDDEATRREVMGAGCAAYLGKPVSGRTLVDAIASAVGPPRWGR